MTISRHASIVTLSLSRQCCASKLDRGAQSAYKEKSAVSHTGQAGIRQPEAGELTGIKNVASMARTSVEVRLGGVEGTILVDCTRRDDPTVSDDNYYPCRHGTLVGPIWRG